MADNFKSAATKIDEIEHCWIPMPDNVRLAARLWLPKDVGPVPAILEYIPYRKRDMVRARDERNHPYFAANGYACLRVDMRGSGDSEGVMPDMYAGNELDDARHLIEWIAAQPWCSGKVGMFGTSWGGTASLQAAVDAPGPLKAVIANCATVDRFEDDIHWMGGCLLTDSLEWGATLPVILAAPPDRAMVGDAWFDMWKARLDRMAFPFENWVRHATRGPYWRHGSVRFQADRLSCPTLTIGGWSDRYSNSVMRLVRARPDICRGIVGPWGHHYPDHGEPGPDISFQDVALAWWDHWLKADNTKLPDWPPLQLWQRDFDPPQNRLAERNGHWIAVDGQDQETATRFHLGDRTLSPEHSQNQPLVLDVPFDTRHGECAGDTGYFGRPGGLPLDQSPDDGRALCFDTDPLSKDVHLVGHAELSVAIDADRLPAQIACRICDVAPDGRSNLVTRTVLSLGLDDTLDGPRKSIGHRAERYRITFPSTAYRVQAGHRIRLAIGASYWPLVWPVARPTRIGVHTDSASLALPNFPRAATPVPGFPEPRDLPQPKSWTQKTRGDLERSIAEPDGAFMRMGWTQPLTTTAFSALELELSYTTSADYRMKPGDPATAECSIVHEMIIGRPDGEAKVTGQLRLAFDNGGYLCTFELTATWNGKEAFRTSDTRSLPGDVSSEP
ncbi:MAG: CocE/NonD family hydrolase [Silicimonas sp.]|nr:CocE/NonD family hydrolase [Silicimonas sp.]